MNETSKISRQPMAGISTEPVSENFKTSTLVNSPASEVAYGGGSAGNWNTP